MAIRNRKPVRLRLNPNASQYFLSSGNYSNLTNQLLVPLDMIATFGFRWPRVFDYDIPSAEGGSPTTNGPVIDYTSTHPGAAGALISMMLLFAIGNVIREYRKQKKIQDNNNYNYICTKLKEKLLLTPRAFDINYYLDKVVKNNIEFSHYSSVQVADDKKTLLFEFAEKKNNESEKDRLTYHSDSEDYENLDDLPNNYDDTSIGEDSVADSDTGFDEVSEKPIPKNKGFIRKLINKSKNALRLFTNKLLSPSWEFIGLASFIYWILWIGFGIVTGNFTTGVAGLGTAGSFAIPFGLAAFYPIIKIWNWKKKNYPSEENKLDPQEEDIDIEHRATAAQDACKIMRCALLLRNFEITCYALKEELNLNDETFTESEIEDACALDTDEYYSIDDDIRFLQEKHNQKVATTFISASLSCFVMSQYAAWILTDFLQLAFNVTVTIPIIGGIILTVAAIGFGMYKAYQAHVSMNEESATINNQLPPHDHLLDTIQTDEAKYEKQLKQIEELKAQYALLGGTDILPTAPAQYNQPQYYRDVERDGPTVMTSVKKFFTRALSFADGAATGVFLARIFFVKGSALFLPCAAALTLGGPYTIAVLVVCGLLYGAFKFYQYHQSRKADYARQLFAQRSERIECLGHQIKFNDLTIRVLKKRIRDIKSTVSAKSKSTQKLFKPKTKPAKVNAKGVNDNDLTTKKKPILLTPVSKTSSSVSSL